MKQFSHLLLLLLLSVFISQCTVQKRLYTRGYHIGYRKKFRSDNSAEIRDSSTAVQQILSIAEKCDLPNEMPEETDHVTDTTIVIVNNGKKRDTIYGRVLTNEEIQRKKKETRLVGVGIPMVVTGVLSAAAFSASNAAQLAASIYFFGSVGWILALITVILLAIFIIILTSPDTEKKKEPKTGLTKGERIGLIISLTIVSIIAAVFWLKGLV